jgi:hypothetical protein
MFAASGLTIGAGNHSVVLFASDSLTGAVPLSADVLARRCTTGKPFCTTTSVPSLNLGNPSATDAGTMAGRIVSPRSHPHK